VLNRVAVNFSPRLSTCSPFGERLAWRTVLNGAVYDGTPGELRDTGRGRVGVREAGQRRDRAPETTKPRPIARTGLVLTPTAGVSPSRRAWLKIRLPYGLRAIVANVHDSNVLSLLTNGSCSAALFAVTAVADGRRGSTSDPNGAPGESVGEKEAVSGPDADYLCRSAPSQPRIVAQASSSGSRGPQYIGAIFV
jgi:hypothetical protein